jgi:hypothetical protein
VVFTEPDMSFKSIMEVVSDPQNGTPMDMLRLFLIYFLCSTAVSDGEYDQYAGALQVLLILDTSLVVMVVFLRGWWL